MDEGFWYRFAIGASQWPPAGSPEFELMEMELAARRCAGRGHRPEYYEYSHVQSVQAAACACGEARFVRVEDAS